MKRYLLILSFIAFSLSMSLSPAITQDLVLSPFNGGQSRESYLSLNIGIVCKFF